MNATGGSRVMVAVRVCASPARAFEAFTAEIGSWWKPNGLFAFTRDRTGTLEFVPGPEGRLVERYEDGGEFVIGEIIAWDPPHHLAMTWRQAGFGEGQLTHVHVRFTETDDDRTRVCVEHFGWDAIPIDHVARHGFPLAPFQQRLAEWWQDLLDVFRAQV